MPRKRGRPKIGPELIKFSAYFTREDMRILMRKCREEGVSASHLLRTMIRKGLP